MAKLERTIHGEFSQILNKIVSGVINGSASATLEESSDYSYGNVRCSVRVFERYSFFGGNRVSMNVTLFQAQKGTVHLTAITSGGSQAMFFKINTLGEETFMETLNDILEE